MTFRPLLRKFYHTIVLKKIISLTMITKNKDMTIRIQKDTVNYADLHKYLISTFPRYRFWLDTNNTLKITKKGIFAVYVSVKRNKIIIRKGLANYKLYILAALLFIGLGVILPLFIYYFVIFPRMNMFSQEILDAIYAYYRHTVLNYSLYGNDQADSEG